MLLPPPGDSGSLCQRSASPGAGRVGVGGVSQTRLLSVGQGETQQGAELLLWVGRAAASGEGRGWVGGGS